MITDPTRNKLRTMLGELLDHIEGAQEVASGIAQEHPDSGLRESRSS